MESSFDGCSINRGKGQWGIELDYLQFVWGHGNVLQYTEFRKNILSKGERVNFGGHVVFIVPVRHQVDMSSGQVDINKQIMCELF